MESSLAFRRARRIADRRKLGWAVGLTGATFVAEAVGGFLTNSLALLSDAGHMFTHLLALAVSLLAVIFSHRPPTERRTFGLNRLEILAALFNGATLFLITLGIFYEAYRRFLEPVPIATGAMLLIASLGLAVNLSCAWILRGSDQRDLNIRGAFIHLLSDTFSSVVVIVGALAISISGMTVLDPILSVLICVAILYWAFRLVLDSVDVLLEATPRDVDIQGVIEGLRRIPGVRDVHHLHVWTITSGIYALSAHLDVDDLKVSETEKLAQKAEQFLRERFHINHTTFQFECQRGVMVDDALKGAGWGARAGGGGSRP